MDLAARVNTDRQLSELSMRNDRGQELSGIMPVTATPAALAAGVAAGAALVGAAAAGAAVGEATD